MVEKCLPKLSVVLLSLSAILRVIALCRLENSSALKMVSFLLKINHHWSSSACLLTVKPVSLGQHNILLRIAKCNPLTRRTTAFLIDVGTIPQPHRPHFKAYTFISLLGVGLNDTDTNTTSHSPEVKCICTG